MKIFYNEDIIPDNIPRITNCDPQILLNQLITNANKNGANVKASDFKSVVILDEDKVDDNKINIDEWIRENMEEPSAIVLSAETFNYYFYFIGEADAMAFKIMWMD